MSETDGEIEYLDEDADIVQQCVQSVSLPVETPVQVAETPVQVTETPVQAAEASAQESENEHEKKLTPLLVERKQKDKKRKRKLAEKLEEDDSDYDPRDDASTPSTTSRSSSQRSKKRKLNSAKKVTKPIPISHSTPYQTVKVHQKKPPPVVDPIKARKKMDIVIPDYEDPLCLPVRAFSSDECEAHRLKNWNNACLEHLRNSDSLLNPENGRTVGSTRSVVIRNVVNTKLKKYEISIWSKTCVENDSGVKKSQIFQSILPKYREKKVLDVRHLNTTKRPKTYHHTDEVILTKESTDKEESLVIYRPKEALSTVYKFTDKDSELKDSESTEERESKSIREVVCCKICAPCYQASWRGIKKGRETRSMKCPVCNRSSVSVYNLLTHVKTHDAIDVQKKRLQLATILKQAVEYHYKCRICQQQFLSIKELRQHVSTHRGKDIFRCEIGNHLTN